MFLSCRFGCFLSAITKRIDITLPKFDEFYWRLANFQNVSLTLLSQDFCICVLLITRLKNSNLNTKHYRDNSVNERYEMNANFRSRTLALG
jgi:hypothetical protein